MTVCYWCGAKDTLADVGKELDDGKYKMVQCSKCKTAYYVLNKEKVNKPKPMTNEEWLRSATTEQLAEWLNNKIIICAVCDQQKSCEYLINETCHLCPFHEGKNKSWEVWLKQPHNSPK